MWANAQRDGRPVKYRFCSTPQFGWRPLLQCPAVTLPRRETRWNYLGCPKLTKRSQPLVGRSSPYCKDMWRRYYCLTSFSDCRYVPYSCEDIARQSCGMVPRWRFFSDILRPVFSASRVLHVSDLRLKFALATPCVAVSYTSNLRRLRLGEGKRRRYKKIADKRNHRVKKLAATLRGSRPGVQSASLIMTSFMTS